MQENFIKNTNKAYFSITTYTISIRTHLTQNKNSLFLIETPVFTRFFKKILVYKVKYIPIRFRKALILNEFLPFNILLHIKTIPKVKQK